MKEYLKTWHDFPQIQTQLPHVRKIMEQQAQRATGSVGEALVETFQHEGKLLRPALVLLFSEFGPVDKKDPKKLVQIAAAVEILHNATLIHDDLIDESDTRRGQPSIQAKYGKKVAIYAGDYLFAICFQLLSQYSRSKKSLQYDGNIMAGILSGELEQMENTYYQAISIKQYRQQINGKTGLLFGMSCFLGTYEGGLSIVKARKAAKFGELLGQAFQVQDDLLDYTATATQIKKPVLLDVKNGIYSAPLIYALEADSSGQLQALVDRGAKLTQSELREIKRLVTELGGVTKAQQLMQDILVESTEFLNKHFPTSAARADVLKLTELIAHRQN